MGGRAVRARALPAPGRRRGLAAAGAVLLAARSLPSERWKTRDARAAEAREPEAQAQASGAREDETAAAMYDGRNVAGDYELVNDADGPLARFTGVSSLRTRVLERAYGEVLEVAVGTGINLPRYDLVTRDGSTGGGKVSRIVGVDVSREMLRIAEGRARAVLGDDGTGSTGGDRDIVDFVRADASALPFDDASFDTVVDTFGICVFENPAAVVREMCRVLRPGGRLLLLEHSRSVRNGLLARYQDMTAPYVAAMGHGCTWNQDVLRLVTEAWTDGDGGATRETMKVTRVEDALFGLLTTVEAEKAVV